MAEQLKGSKTSTPITRGPVPIDQYDNAVDQKMRDEIAKYRPTYTQGTDAKPQDFSKVENAKAVGQGFNPKRS